MSSMRVSQTFNRQPLTEEITDNGQKKTITTGAVIETAQEITLTQDAARLETPGYVLVSKDQHLHLYGDLVRIEGRLSMPGKNFLVVARRLILADDAAGNSPAIVVDGPPLEEKDRKPKPLNQGETTKGSPVLKKQKGTIGPSGWCNRIWPIWLESDTIGPGGPGESAKDHPEQMHGEPGHDGRPGRDGGNVKILCERLDYRELLFGRLGLNNRTSACQVRLTTSLRPEELESEGENLVLVAAVGRGLRIRIFDGEGKVVADQPESALVAGDKLSRLRKRFEMSWSDVLRAGDWSQGLPSDAKPAQQRQVLIDQLSGISGLPKELLGKLDDYGLIGRGAVTAFLLQAGIRDQAGLRVDGHRAYRNTLIRALAASNGFDVPSLEALDDQQLVRVAVAPSPTNKFVLRGGAALLRQRVFGLISISDVLETTGWLSAHELNSMPSAARREALVDHLSRLSNLPKDEIGRLGDYELIGHGAVVAVLLQSGRGVRPGTALDGHRRALIDHAVESEAFDARQLEALGNQELVRRLLKRIKTGRLSDLHDRIENALNEKRRIELATSPTTIDFQAFPRVPMTPADVLVAGNWLTEEQAAAMAPGNQRQALVNQLSRITHMPADWLSGLRDYDLIGRGAAIAFLRQMGMVNEDALGIDWSLDNYRNTLIVETAGLGYDVGALQGLTDQQLVRLVLEHAGDRWRLGPRLAALRDQLLRLAKKDEEDILADLTSILGLPARDGFSISACGGAGGDGQQGQQGAEGGDGGPGWSFTKERQEATGGGDGGQGGNGGKGGRGGPGGKGGSVLVHLIAGGLQPSVNNKGGDAGLPGEGGPRGEGGAPGLGGQFPDFVHGKGWVWVRKPSGKPGTRGEVGPKGDPGSRGADGAQQLSNGNLTPESLVANTRVSQLVMMWQRVRAEYVATDPTGLATMAEIVSRVDWVATLLKAVPQSSPDFPLTAAVLPGILSTRVAARVGLDYFGFGPYDVPAGSIALYREWLNNALPALEKLETDFTRYFEALRNETDATAAFSAAAAKAADRKKALENYRTALTAKITHELEKIQEFEGKEGKRTKDRKVVKSKLMKFSDEVDKAFGLTPETFLNCLSQLSFTSPENPMGAGIMVASQFGTVVHEGTNHILSDSGELVKKSWVLQNINQFDSPDLKADFVREKGEYINESASYRTVASLEKLKGLLGQFVKGKHEAEEACRAVQAHIDLIAERNRHIDYYNSLLREMVELASEQRRLDLEERIAIDGMTKKTPGLSPMTNFVYGMYEETKRDCLEALNMLYRAQSFWSLSPLSDFYKVIGSSPEAITHSQLMRAQSALWNGLVTEIGGSHRPSPFTGIFVVLTREKHGKFFENLELWSKASFHLAPATKRSQTTLSVLEPTEAAFTGDTFPEENVRHPFYGRSNVRLTKVRAWMVGMTTPNGIHMVNIQHCGREILYLRDNTPYPARMNDGDFEAPLPLNKVVQVAHAPVSKTFVYGSAGLALDLAKSTFSKGKLRGISGAQDGDLNYSENAELGLPGEKAYAAIGPFATWQLDVPISTNADFSQMNAIVMEFDGFCEGFE